MRTWTAGLIIALSLTLGACSRQQTDSKSGEAQKKADTAARKLGRGAHEVADETKALADKADRKLRQAAKEAREGWNEADRESKTKRSK